MNYYGKKVCGGIVTGNVIEVERKFENIQKDVVTDTKEELAKFEKAKTIVKEQLEKLYQNVYNNIGEEEAYIFKVHMMFLEDNDYNESIHNVVVKQSVSIVYAIRVVEEKFVEMFMSMDDEYMKVRSADIKDVSNRLIEALNDMSFDSFYKNVDKPSIIVADDLLPSEIIKLDNTNILAVVCREGAINSHTSIIARAMNIPCMIQVSNLPKEINGRTIIVDCFSDVVYLDPDEDTCKKYEKQIQLIENEVNDMYSDIVGKRIQKKDGRYVRIYSNCNFFEEVKKAFDNDAEGIGLFRTEFLYFEKETLPNENQQFELYKNILQIFDKNKDGEKRVCIRTFDIGADKKCKSLHIPYENNPALGFRGIRFALANEKVLKTQLRALYKASIYGKLAIMFPMITSMEEVFKVKSLIEEVKHELINQNIIFNDNVELGIMIETPAAVMISDKLSKEVDFFSIGSNDLVQYTLAADRLNSNMKEYYNVYHEAIYRMIQITIESAHKNGIWVGICGDLACDMEVVKRLVNMGIDELSVPVGKILEVRNRILE